MGGIYEMLSFIVFFCLGLFYGNVLEYIIHRYVFHKIGRKKQSIFRYHLKGHHVLSKKNNFIDLTTSKVENWGLFLLVMFHIPFFWINLGFWAGISLYALLFKIMHGYQHSNPSFTKKWMKWHWNHHMTNPNENYGVVAPWADYLFGTRKKR